MSTELYERDFYAWANQQAALLRAGQLAAADIEHIAEEIEGIGRCEKRELVGRLKVALLYMLRWQFQPDLRRPSWQHSITNARDEIDDHLNENPSLKAMLPAAMASAYKSACRAATAETGLPEAGFPPACPYSAEQISDETFWPE
jgi:hypothetical protein